jgi:putative MATE family efflux protein
MPPDTTEPDWKRIYRLALPTTLVAFAQGAGQMLEVWFVGHLGTEALAGYALVLPLLLLLQGTSSGAMGGGVSSAIARALGGGRPKEAADLVWHAMVIAVGMGVLYTFVVEVFGEKLFSAMGGRGAVLDHAVSYSSWLFAGATLAWITNTLAAVLRGAGNMRLPARIMLVMWPAQALLSGVLLMGTKMGLAGAGLAYSLGFLAAAGVMGYAILSGGAGFKPAARFDPQMALFGKILSVGAIATVMAFIANLNTVLVTRIIADEGIAAIAAYGIGVRLEFMMIPLAFGIGAALTTLVGMAVGRGDWKGARRVAWTGALMSGGLAGGVGLMVSLFPTFFSRIFSADPAVQAATRLYLVIVGPSFAGLGVGMAFYFASQGAGRMRIPFVAALSRLTLAVGGGWALSTQFGMAGAFMGVAAALFSYGAIVAWGVRPGYWGPKEP